MSAHKGVGGRGGRWARSYSSKWRVEPRGEIIGLYWLLSGRKKNRKHLLNFMSPYIHLPLIFVKPGSSQARHLNLSQHLGRMSVKTSLE